MVDGAAALDDSDAVGVGVAVGCYYVVGKAGVSDGVSDDKSSVGLDGGVSSY